MVESSKKPRGLGRGLSALMSDVDVSTPAIDEKPTGFAPIESVRPNPDQPRRVFDKEDLENLAASIKEKGIIQPLIVRKSNDQAGVFEIVAGERRWRAAQLAQLHEVPIVVREFTDVEVLEIAIIENIQRKDLNPVEEAQGYRQLMEKFGHTQEHVGQALGKSRSYIANLLRLLNLPNDVQNMISNGTLSAGHARALVTSENPLELAKIVSKKGLSVRETERLAKQANQPTSVKTNPTKEKDADTKALEADLSAAIGMGVSLDHKVSNGAGTLTINYKSLEQLDKICALLSKT